MLSHQQQMSCQIEDVNHAAGRDSFALPENVQSTVCLESDRYELGLGRRPGWMPEEDV